jgi:hypothetical protein
MRTEDFAVLILKFGTSRGLAHRLADVYEAVCANPELEAVALYGVF